MLVNYKNIDDTLSEAELNAYACLLQHNKTLTDTLRLKNGAIQGEYGKYTFDLSNASIVDNGILVTDETISNDITVKLENPTQNATYTLHLTVLRYGETSLLDEVPVTETIDLTVDLQKDTAVVIPMTDLQEYDVILFNSNITIKHDKPEINGAYITALDITANNPIIQTSETSILEITATDLEHLPMPNKSIQLLKNNTLLDTLTTDSQGKATYTYTGQGSGKLDFIAKYRGLQSEPYEVLDCFCMDLDGSNSDWYNGNITVSTNDGVKTISKSTTGNGYYLANIKGSDKSSLDAVTEFPPSFKCEFDIVTYSSTGTVYVHLSDGTNTNNKGLASLGVTDGSHVEYANNNGAITIKVDGATKTPPSETYGTCRIGFIINNSSCSFKNFKIYPI